MPALVNKVFRIQRIEFIRTIQLRSFGPTLKPDVATATFARVRVHRVRLCPDTMHVDGLANVIFQVLPRVPGRQLRLHVSSGLLFGIVVYVPLGYG